MEVRLGIVKSALCVAIIAGAASAQALSGWYSNWNTALNSARKEQKPLVALFAREGCEECTTMEATLASSGARGALSGAVKVRIEQPNSPDLSAQFGVASTPTLLLFTPDTGYATYVAREDGAQSLSQIISLGRVINSSTTPAAEETAKSKTETTTKKKSTRKSSSKTKGKASKETAQQQTAQQQQYQYQYSGSYQQPSSSQYYYPQPQEQYRNW